MRIVVPVTDSRLPRAQNGPFKRRISPLKSQAWEKIVCVRDSDQKVDSYLKYGDDRIHGLTVMAVDAEEAVFIKLPGRSRAYAAGQGAYGGIPGPASLVRHSAGLQPGLAAPCRCLGKILSDSFFIQGKSRF